MRLSRTGNTFLKRNKRNLIEAYYARLTSEDGRCAPSRCKSSGPVGKWPQAACFPDPSPTLEKAEDLDFAVAFARIECHYFINAIFVEEAHILNHAEVIAHIPTVIVQGRYDVVCPTRSAWELHKALPQSNLIIVADAGHSMGEVSIARELVAATDSVSE